MPIFFSPFAARRRLLKATLAASLAGLLAACASVPPPDNSMNLAQIRLQEARDAGAADYAPVDLGFAQDKFQQAQMAMADRDYAAAADLSEESRADAELAQAKARLGAARAEVRKKVEENKALKERGESTTGAASGSRTPATDIRTSGEMPAPEASTLSAPSGSGFQTLPANGQPGSGGFQTVPAQPASPSSSNPPPGGQP